MKIELPVEARKIYPSRRTCLEMGTACAGGATKAEAAVKLAKVIEQHCTAPSVALVRDGDEIRVLVSHAGTTEIFRPVDRDQQGVVLLTCTTTCGGDIKDEAESTVVHLLQQRLDHGDEIPEHCPAKHRSDLLRYLERRSEMAPA